MTNPTYRQIWSISWPMIVSGASTPFLGLVDTWAIGNLGAAAPLGAIALGTLVFHFLYWGLGFLRMGTTGLTAQAFGAANESRVQNTLGRAVLTGLVFGAAMIVLQVPLGWLAFTLLDAGPEVQQLAKEYYLIRIWGAPATLATFAILGWFIGLQRTKWALGLQLWLNGVNLVLDITFVFVFGMGVAGIAAGTLIAELSTFALAIYLCARLNRLRINLSFSIDPERLKDMAALKQLLQVNTDIFIRTLGLLLIFGWFTAVSADFGDEVLAANYILLQFVTFSAFFLDGFANAAEALTGSAIGARNRAALSQAVRKSSHLAVMTALALSLFILLSGSAIIDFLTNVAEVRDTAAKYLPWAIIIPAISVWSFQFDGVYIGATWTRDMRNLMVLALVIYLAALYALTPVFANHGLWAAMIVSYIARGGTLAWRYPALARQAIP